MSVKIVLANKTNKQALIEWEEFLLSIRDSTPIDSSETEEQKEARIKWLEKPGNEEEWFAYYFPKYCFCKPAPFHKKSTRAFLKSKRVYHSRIWARGLSKSTRRMFEIFYKKFVQRLRVNMLLVSKTEGNAIRLLSPYRANLEANLRLINDYGIQKRSGKWKEEEFITRDKCSFRAVGMEQNPRGAKIEELRINVIVFDDADDDEVCRNEDRLSAQWLWIEQAVIPTVDIASEYYICFDNNLIAEDSLAFRASEKATIAETINIRDEFGNSVWPHKNSEKDIDDIEGMISYESFQKEYMNNPISDGKTFPEITWGRVPALKHLKFVITYADPATSNKDRPTLKSKAKNSCKAVVTVGYHKENYYIFKAFVDNTSNAKFIDWIYAANDWVGVQSVNKKYIENNSLQDPFYQQVFKPLLRERAKELKKLPIHLIPDDRNKGDKWVRIEATLEPLNRNGHLIFNKDQEDDPHMKRLAKMFTSAKPTSRLLDGPDAVEGAVHLLKGMLSQLLEKKKIEPVEISNSKRY
ncbi:MAG: hypothetical protein ACT4OJ_08755 [Bacteroidota bacterium]